jgi:hypothetical protein
MEIYCSRFFRIKSGIEELMRIGKHCPLKKVQFHGFLESASSTHKSLVRPYRRLPLPFLFDVRVGGKDQLTQPSKHLAAPVGEFCDPVLDMV